MFLTDAWKSKKTISYIYLLQFLADVIFRFNKVKFIYNKRNYLCDLQSYKLIHLSLGAKPACYYLINN